MSSFPGRKARMESVREREALQDGDFIPQETLGVTVVEDDDIKVKVESIENDSVDLDPFDRIMAMIEDPSSDVALINKRIAIEIAKANRGLAELRNDSTMGYRLKPIVEQIKALRELSRTIQETEDLSHRDVLNFDGPKFGYVMAEVVNVFKKCLSDSGLGEDTVNNIMRLYRDKLSVKEAELRRDVSRFDKINRTAE